MDTEKMVEHQKVVNLDHINEGEQEEVQVSHDQIMDHPIIVVAQHQLVARPENDFEIRQNPENLNSSKGQRKGDFQVSQWLPKTQPLDNALESDTVRYSWQDAMSLFHKIKTNSKDEFLNSNGPFMDIQHSARMNLIDKKQREQGINLQVHVKIAMQLIAVGVLYYFKRLNIFFPTIKGEFNLDKYSPGSKEQWRRYDELAAKFAMKELDYENFQPDWKTATTPKRGAEADAKRRKLMKEDGNDADRTEEIYGAYVIEEQVFFKIRTYSNKTRFVQVNEVCDLPQFQKFLVPLTVERNQTNTGSNVSSNLLGSRQATKEELQLVTQPFAKVENGNPLSVTDIANHSMNLTPLTNIMSPVGVPVITSVIHNH